MRRPAITAIVFAVALGSAAPASAADDAAGPATTVALGPAGAALVPLQAEIMLLVELDALAVPLPPRVRQVHAQWRSYAAGQSRTDLLRWLDDVDAQGAAALPALRATAGWPSGQVVTALGRIGDADRAALDRRERIGIAPAVYERAWLDLTERDGRPSSGVTLPTAPAAPRQATTIAAPAPTEGTVTATWPAPPSTAAASPTEPGTAPPGALTALAALLAVAVTLLGWFLTRRSIARHGAAGGAVDDLLDAGRRLTAARDPAEAAGVAVAEAVAVTHAIDGAYVVRDPDGSARPLHSGRPLPDDELARGAIPRALDTGQAARAHRPGRALMATPVVHDGAVLGALVVLRSTPFLSAEQEALGRLAPLAAAALHAADRHAAGAELAYVDALTSLGNRRRFDRDLDALAAQHTALVVVMLDVDHFKAYNDRHGHQRGDDALRLVASTLRSCVRDDDLVYRYGGEEFSILLPGATRTDAVAVGERIRAALRHAGATEDQSDALTVSIGLAAAAADGASAAVERADGALYAAKREGRDRIVVAP